ncbi:MAG: NosD domain-containing protein [Methanobacteriota archaeon]
MGRIDNTQDVETYTEIAPMNTIKKQYDLLIISTRELAPGFTRLVTAHNAEGIRTCIRILGVDIPFGANINKTCENIRDYIKREYLQHGIEYVLLGGDHDVVPARLLFYGEDWEWGRVYGPSDNYYACLDGSYNSDGDNDWGEPTDGGDIPGGSGDVDLMAEVYVGRACVGNMTEVGIFVNKTVAYMQRYASLDLIRDRDEFFRTVLMVGEDLGWGGMGWWYMEQLIDESTDQNYLTIGFPPEKYVIDKLYDNESHYFTAGELIDRVNNGVYIINHLGHSLHDYSMKLCIENISELTNSQPCFIYSQGCLAGAFDDPEGGDCMAEYFTVKTKYGAFAGIWNSRLGLTDYDGPASQTFHRQFWDAVFYEDIPVISKANQDSKEDNIYLINEVWYMHWLYYELNLFGDPTLRFYDRPLLCFIDGQTEALINTSVQFTSQVSGDNIQPLKWYWDFGDGYISNKPDPIHVFTRARTYTLMLTVIDSARQSHTDTWDIIIRPPVVWVDANFTDTTPGWGEDHFSTIQAGIDMVYYDGTVYVAPGIYRENLDIRKPLTLLGEDKNLVIIDGGGIETAMQIYANQIIVTGFTIQNNGIRNGIYINSVENTTINDTIIKNTTTAISLSRSYNQHIIGNTFINNDYGVRPSYSDHSVIDHNLFIDTDNSISPLRSSNLTIIKNTICNQSLIIQGGISLDSYCDGSIVRENTVTNASMWGIRLYQTKNNLVINNTISSNKDGIYLYRCSYGQNTITGNLITNNYGHGIYSYDYAYDFLIRGNMIANNTGSGIYLRTHSQRNIIVENTITHNDQYGIYLGSGINTIYHNNFINTINAYVLNSANNWDHGPLDGGNFWSDWESNLGYPNTYIINTNNIDYYPFQSPNGWFL